MEQSLLPYSEDRLDGGPQPPHKETHSAGEILWFSGLQTIGKSPNLFLAILRKSSSPLSKSVNQPAAQREDFSRESESARTVRPRLPENLLRKGRTRVTRRGLCLSEKKSAETH